ncbi:helix-turn-helix transcriptional regulator [Duganella sp. BuS-21]|uniref:helix-turn-helix transcriptional regulator n=1 Tax=Duganella sp. BuS-21 TaxID=2943848 RepID=UPI0035A6273F
MKNKIVLRISDIASTSTKAGLLPVSKATIWRWVKIGTFPAPFKLGAGVTGWHAGDIDAFIAKCAQKQV